MLSNNAFRAALIKHGVLEKWSKANRELSTRPSIIVAWRDPETGLQSARIWKDEVMSVTQFRKIPAEVLRREVPPKLWPEDLESRSATNSAPKRASRPPLCPKPNPT
jgi:hypothetical protein